MLNKLSKILNFYSSKEYTLLLTNKKHIIIHKKASKKNSPLAHRHLFCCCFAVYFFYILFFSFLKPPEIQNNTILKISTTSQERKRKIRSKTENHYSLDLDIGQPKKLHKALTIIFEWNCKTDDCFWSVVHKDSHRSDVNLTAVCVLVSLVATRQLFNSWINFHLIIKKTV